MAHEMTPADAMIILSGILLVVSLFVLSVGDEECQTCFIRVRALQGFFSSFGEIFWTTWLVLCLAVFVTGLSMKLTHHELKWKTHAPAPVRQLRPRR